MKRLKEQKNQLKIIDLDFFVYVSSTKDDFADKSLVRYYDELFLFESFDCTFIYTLPKYRQALSRFFIFSANYLYFGPQ